MVRAARALLLRSWTEATGRTAINPGELPHVLALAPALRSEEEAAGVLQALYSRPDVAGALERGHTGDLAVALRRAGVEVSPRELGHNVQLVARELGEPLHVVDRQAEESQPSEVLTVDGWIAFEGEYVPRVVTAENGRAHPEALRAQAIAARTYVLHAMRDDPELGRSRPIPNSTQFQVYARDPTRACIEATEATRAIVARHRGELVTANYVAGALWMNDGSPGEDQFNTERFVTYNEGKTGAQVQPTPLSRLDRADNRGCMSQNGADWLGRHYRRYPEILRYFYGADLELVGHGPSPTASSNTAAAVPILLAAAVVAVAR